MNSYPPGETKPSRPRLRWWPALVILALAAGLLIWLRVDPSASFQQRNLRTLALALITGALLFLWWLTCSRSPWKLRLGLAALVLGAGALAALIFRIQGVTGDLLPIVEFRWTPHTPSATPTQVQRTSPPAPLPLDNTADAAPDYPQFLGPHRTAVLDTTGLGTNWTTSPPEVIWRQPIGPAWSGWAIVGTRALTQEQRAEGECVTCYDLATGRLIWSHADPPHYRTTIAGEGPRCTPTVTGNRVFTLGATGLLNCLDLATGARVWSRNIAEQARVEVPEWGFAGSPLVHGDHVVVIAGGPAGRSLLAFRKDSGEEAWHGGDAPAGYGTPVVAVLAGVEQILAFHPRSISAQDPRSGEVLWEHPWGNGQPQVAVPVVAGTNRVLFSSGYGVGSVLLEIRRGAEGRLTAAQVWKSNRLKAKFATIVRRGGHVYGLDDGILACLDLADGSQRWKEGRYGHGQGLLVGDLYLLMAENGELVLLRPTPDAPNELHRFRVFNAKTWNPIALAGDRLLCRNDQETACLRLPLEPPKR